MEKDLGHRLFPWGPHDLLTKVPFEINKYSLSFVIILVWSNIS